MFVKPAPGRLVRDPHTKRPLPAEGCEVPETSYWLRRLRSDDILKTAPPAPLATDAPKGK